MFPYLINMILSNLRHNKQYIKPTYYTPYCYIINNKYKILLHECQVNILLLMESWNIMNTLNTLILLPMMPEKKCIFLLRTEGVHWFKSRQMIR